jgi:cellobiose phosphorylase
LYKVLSSFADVALAHNHPNFSARCSQQAEAVRGNLAEHAWDGAWYKRAWFDDDTPLGSAGNVECKIDSISQSWSVLSGAGDAQRSQQAMNSLDQHLVQREQGLVLLLDPPFDQSELDPGYIKGYVPGVRENGGQYTHAAVWAAMAFAELGDSTRAWELMELINPINHTVTAEAIATYKTEPYAVAADVYGVEPHIGRGGWTWYTGAAGWLYRLIVESLMGVSRQADKLTIKPCLPHDWDHCSIRYRYAETTYLIDIRQVNTSDEDRASTISLDGVDVGDQSVLLVDDQQQHTIDVLILQQALKAPKTD